MKIFDISSLRIVEEPTRFVLNDDALTCGMHMTHYNATPLSNAEPWRCAICVFRLRYILVTGRYKHNHLVVSPPIPIPIHFHEAHGLFLLCHLCEA